jgi:CDP-6-deoxy-D-xylo-4-hexulose-3-dehydrase
MIKLDEITSIVGNHVPPYLYGRNFIPGETLIPYSGPYWDSREAVAAINAFLNGGWITAGENVFAFEEAFSKRFNTKHSLMVNSGSSANLVLITALKKYFHWEDGDGIIVSPVGFPTTISVICQNNLVPVFIDIEWCTLNFDLDYLERRVSQTKDIYLPPIKAIFLSPVLGNPPDMDRLCEICERYDIKLIVDNCDSLGSKWNGRYLSEYGIAFSNSFYPAHHISTGEGGMVCTNDEDLMKIMISLAWWGRDCVCVGEKNLLKNGSCGRRFDKWLNDYDGIVDHKYVFSNMGYNLKPLDLQGAIGRVQLDKFDEIERRRKISKSVIEQIVIEQIKGVCGVGKYDQADVCWFGTPFICETKELKVALVKHFERNKIQTRNYFSGNILLHPGYRYLSDSGDYPEANKVLDFVFFLGAAPHYSEKVFDYVYEVVEKFENGL